MTNLIKKTAIVLAIGIGSLALTNIAQAQSTGGGNNNGNGGRGDYSGDTPGGESDNPGGISGVHKPLIISEFNPNKIPRIPRRPKYKEPMVAFESQRSPCGTIYNQITNQNMLVMVPRYNDCIRRGLEN